MTERIINIYNNGSNKLADVQDKESSRNRPWRTYKSQLIVDSCEMLSPPKWRNIRRARDAAPSCRACAPPLH